MMLWFPFKYRVRENEWDLGEKIPLDKEIKIGSLALLSQEDSVMDNYNYGQLWAAIGTGWKNFPKPFLHLRPDILLPFFVGRGEN